MKTKNLNYSQKILAVLIIATGLISIAWLNPASQKDSCLPLQMPTEKDHLISLKATPAVSPTLTLPFIAQVSAEPSAKPTLVTPSISILPIPRVSEINDVPIAPIHPIQQDTLPPIKEKNAVAPRHEIISKEDEQRLEEAKEKMQEAQNQMREAEETMREINWKKINENIEMSMKNIDWKKISKAQQKAMKSIDWKNMDKEVALAMKNINWQQIQLNIQAAQQNINWNEVRANVKEGMKQAKAGMDQAQKERLSILRKMHDAQREMDRSLNEKITLQQGKAERDSYQQFINRMAADKLLDISQPFVIEKKNNDLYINGVKQLPAVIEKYSKYLDKIHKMTIRGENNNLDINIDNN